MKTIAYTMVQNDMVILQLWINYYKRFFDRLFVIGNATKDEYREHLDNLKKTHALDYEILPTFQSDSFQTVSVVREYSERFHKEYDWVLHSDCDEIVIADPRKFKNLHDFMSRQRRRLTHCEGWDVIQMADEEAIDYARPYLAQRSHWARNTSYNKPLLAKRPIDWAAGCHKEHGMDDEESKSIENTGLYLLHLKYSDMSAQRDFGPTLTSFHGDVLENAHDTREPIPENIRKIF